MSDSLNEDEGSSLAEQLYWREVSELLETQVKQIVRAVQLALDEDLWEPALMLMLGFIDASAWLARPDHHDDVMRDDFIAWVNTYLLPDSKLECTAEELYGARCGMLHSLTAESKLHRQEKIRKIFWSRAKEGNVYTLLQLRLNEKFLPVGVGIDHFFWALGQACDRFGKALESDDALARRVGARVHTSYLRKMRRLG